MFSSVYNVLPIVPIHPTPNILSFATGFWFYDKDPQVRLISVSGADGTESKGKSGLPLF
jgi:hypothetical protein